MTEPEKQVLRSYILGKTKTLNFSILDGIVSGLVSAGILYRATNLGMGDIFPYHITDAAWEYLNHNRHLLAP